MSVNRPGRRHWFANSGLKIRHLRVVAAIERTRNIGRAAAELHTSQPAASKALQELEAAAGLPLFERRAAGTFPTAAGASLVHYAREVFGALDRAGRDLESIAGNFSGHLNIGANFFKGCTNVRPAIGIIDGGGNEEFGRHDKRPLKENARKVVLGENNESQKVRKQKGVIKKGKR